MKNLYLALLLMLFATHSFGQKSLKELSSTPKGADGLYPFWRCATVEVENARKAQNPKLPSDEEFEKFIQKATIHRKQFKMQLLEDQVYIIPVVVHVIHNGEAVGVGSNISYAQILSQIEVLNEDFRRKEGSRGFNDHPAGADSQIEFVLAEVGPNGDPLAEPGVHRVRNTDLGVSGTLDPYRMDRIVKPATYWDPNRYLNMWTANLDGGLLGYAQFPVGSGLPGMDIPGMATAAETDGVVMRFTAFGSSDKGNFNLMAPYDKGRTTTHEVGHFLGLRHIWGDGGCGVDDFCADTPLAEGPNRGCDGPRFSCGSEDMTQNYMDYSTDPCMSIFTQDQKERFLTVLEYCPRRKELLTSNVLARAAFTANKTRVYVGQEVLFTDQSVGGINSWSWTFLGGEPATSVVQNPTVTYAAAGTYNVQLTAGNNNSTFEELKEGYITVVQPSAVPSANFTASSTAVYTGQSVQFNDASHESVYSWNWTFEGGEPANSRQQNPLVQFKEAGSYGVTLTVENALGSAEKTISGMIKVEIGPMLLASPAHYNVQLMVGESKTGNLLIENPGNQSLTYALGSSFTGGSISFAEGENTGTIPAGQSQEVGLTFSPGSLNGGLYSGMIHIQTNDPRNVNKDITVRYEVIGIPAVELSAAALDFGSILKGAFAYDTLLIRNTGTDTLRLTAEIDNTAFSVAASSIVVPVNSVKRLPLAFNPISLGDHTASLVFATNDPENEALTVALSGEALPAPAIEISPESLEVTLLAGDSVNQLLSIRNAGGADLNYTLKLENKKLNGLEIRKGASLSSSAETDNTPVNYSANSDYEGALVLVIQNSTPWYVDIQRDVLTPMGIASQKIRSSAISATDFSVYDLVITAGGESYEYYSSISANAPKFREFVQSGGNVLYLCATNGYDVQLAGGVTLRSGHYEYRNTVVQANHPIVKDLPTTLNGTYASHNIIQNLPANAISITKGEFNKLPTTIEYKLGGGKIIATGMPWEYGFTYGQSMGVMLPNSVEYLLENSISWLVASAYSGRVAGGSEQELTLKINAKHLLGGTYKADLHFLSDDPVNEMLTVPLDLTVTGVPSISLASAEVNFGKLWIRESKVDTLIIHNRGTGDLQLTPALENGVFTVAPNTLVIPAKQSARLPISFEPTEAGNFSAVLVLNTDDPQNQVVEVGLSGMVVAPPHVQLNPIEITVHLNSGEKKTENLLIENTGGDTLYYSLKSVSVNARKMVEKGAVSEDYEVVLVKGEADPRVGEAVVERSGDDGVDGFGYSWIDSRSVNGPRYEWIDIAARGTSLYLGDDNSAEINLPFLFPFYGVEKNKVYISSNGFLTFHRHGASSYYNTNLPNSYTPNDLIAACWTDLYVGDKVKYYGNESYFVVQYTDVNRLSGNGSLTFQIILNRNGDIKIQYKQNTDRYNYGTIGIENASGTKGMEIAFNAQFIENELAVLITADKVLDILPEYGSVVPGGSASVQLDFNAESLYGGVYRKEIVVSTNDPSRLESVIPVTIEVTGVPIITLSHNILRFDSTTFVKATASQKMFIQNSGTMDLEISSLSVSSSEFTVRSLPSTLKPRETLEVLVDFSSAVAGSFSDKLLILSNDPENERVEVTLLAEAFEPPVMELSASSLKGSLKIGESLEGVSLRIVNNGGFPLKAHLSIGSVGYESVRMDPVQREVDFYATAPAQVLVAPERIAAERVDGSAPADLVEEVYYNFIEGVTGMCWVNGELYVLQNYNGRVYKYDFIRKVAVFQFYMPSGAFGLTWDGTYLWTTTYYSANAYNLAGERKGSFNLPGYTNNNRTITWDGKSFLIANVYGDREIYRTNEKGEVLGQYNLPYEISLTQFIAFDSRVWVLDRNQNAVISLFIDGNTIKIEDSTQFPMEYEGYGMAIDNNGKLWIADWVKLYRTSLNTRRLPDWVMGELPGSALEIAAGQEQTLTFGLKALEGLKVGTHKAALTINTNAPAQATATVSMELEIINSRPLVKGSLKDVEMELGKQDLQIELAGLFVDVNAEDKLRYFVKAENDKLEVITSGSVLNVHALRGGKCTVSVFATDQHGGKSESVSFVANVVDKNNRAPKIVLGTSLLEQVQEGGMQNVSLLDVFTDPDGDILTYKVTVENSNCLFAEANGNTLNLFGLLRGSTLLHVKASDGRGGEVELTYKVGVNAPPKVVKAVPSQLMVVLADTVHIPVKDLFSDADQDVLSFTYKAAKNDVVNIRLEEGELHLVVVKKGETMVSVSASDKKGGLAETSFLVVGHHAPQLRLALADQLVRLSEVMAINLFPYFQELDEEAIRFNVVVDEVALKATLTGSVLELQGLAIGESTVTVEAMDSNGAKFTTSFMVNVVEPLSVKQSGPDRIKVYPNPFTDRLMIEAKTDGNHIITIYDQQGRLLLKEQTGISAGKVYALEVSSLQPGNYILQISTTDTHRVYKIVKQ